MSRPTVIAVVAMARCQRHQTTFGIRFEQTRPGEWGGDWAFPIDQRQASREHFDRTCVQGDIRFTPTYPGCPSCGNSGTYLCRCGKLNCWNGQTKAVTCAWCGRSDRVEGIMYSLEVNRDS